MKVVFLFLKMLRLFLREIDLISILKGSLSSGIRQKREVFQSQTAKCNTGEEGGSHMLQTPENWTQKTPPQIAFAQNGVFWGQFSSNCIGSALACALIETLMPESIEIAFSPDSHARFGNTSVIHMNLITYN